MKQNILCGALLLMSLAGAASCSDNFLDETPVDFMSTGNSFITAEDFDCSLNNMYYLLRREFYDRDENRPFDYLYGTDLVYDGEPNGTQRHSTMISAYHPTNEISSSHWNLLFHLIATTNTVIDRLPSSQLTAEQQKVVDAEARFFRGLSYRTLAYLYGGVPLSLNEVTAPNWEYTRASKEETLLQAISDLEQAAAGLPDVDKVKDGKVNTQAAKHLLAELYLATNQNDKAIAAATEVIDHKATALMTHRFGSRMSEPGDLFWDLFRQNNQNRSAGNTEALFVIQVEPMTTGGAGSLVAKEGTYCLERHHAPMFRDVKVNGIAPFSWPVGDYTGGRGIGWAVSTTYFSDEIWKDDFDGDIRNSNYNMVRRIAVHNQAYKALYGDTLDLQNPPAGLNVSIPSRQLYVYSTKCTTPYNHPSGLYANASNYSLTSGAGGTYLDQYMFRLAETYLLRAEAYLQKGDKEKAAADINVVRSRANAKPVEAQNVDMDYILDERMRELGVEEKRRLTLSRTGMLYDRVMKCNPYYAKEMQKHYELLPIPFDEIEANTGAAIQQNPGYE